MFVGLFCRKKYVFFSSHVFTSFFWICRGLLWHAKGSFFDMRRALLTCVGLFWHPDSTQHVCRIGTGVFALGNTCTVYTYRRTLLTCVGLFWLGNTYTYHSATRIHIVGLFWRTKKMWYRDSTQRSRGSARVYSATFRALLIFVGLFWHFWGSFDVPKRCDTVTRHNMCVTHVQVSQQSLTRLYLCVTYVWRTCIITCNMCVTHVQVSQQSLTRLYLRVTYRQRSCIITCNISVTHVQVCGQAARDTSEKPHTPLSACYICVTYL